MLRKDKTPLSVRVHLSSKSGSTVFTLEFGGVDTVIFKGLLRNLNEITG